MSPSLLNPFAVAPAVIPPYDTEVLADSPIAYYRLASMADSSGNSRTLTNIGMNVGGASLLTRDANASAALPGGSGQRAHVDHMSSGGWPEATRAIEAIIKPASTAAGNRFAVCRGWGGVDTFALALLVDGNHMYGACTLSASGPFFIGSTRTFAVNDKIHVLVGHDGTNLRMWIDAVEETPVSAAGSLKVSSWAAVTIGDTGSGAPSLEFNGLVDEVALYSSIPSAARIAAHVAAI